MQNGGSHQKPDGDGDEQQCEPAHLPLANALTVGADVGGGDPHDPGLAEGSQGDGRVALLGERGVSGRCVHGASVHGRAGHVGPRGSHRESSAVTPTSLPAHGLTLAPLRHRVPPASKRPATAPTPLSASLLTLPPTKHQLVPNTSRSAPVLHPFCTRSAPFCTFLGPPPAGTAVRGWPPPASHGAGVVLAASQQLATGGQDLERPVEGRAGSRPGPRPRPQIPALPPPRA